MTATDFERVIKITRPYLLKDSRHTLIIFSVLGLALMVWSVFNDEYPTELLSAGIFLLALGIARYFFERFRRPYLYVVRIKKKVAIPYTRIEGTYDYFIDGEPIENYSFALDGKYEQLPTEPEQRVGVSPDIFKALQEQSQVMILFSATKILVGVLNDNETFISYL